MKLELCPLRGRVTAVPEGKGIPSFYKKYIETEGLYVTSSERVSDEALLKACDIISLMLAKRPDVKAHMVKRGCHVMVIGKDEETCDLPEFAHICNCEDSIKYWNWRARGFGGAPEDELSSSCGEENLLALPQDKYVGENILIHEFAHLIHTVGIVGVNPVSMTGWRLCGRMPSGKDCGKTRMRSATRKSILRSVCSLSLTVTVMPIRLTGCITG